MVSQRQWLFGFPIETVETFFSEAFSFFLLLDSKLNAKCNSCWHNEVIKSFFLYFFEVLALCKELGLDEDESLAPVPKRRKANSRGIALEEKISSAFQHSGSGTCTSKNVTNQQGAETQVCFNAKASEDKKSRKTLPQLDETTACPQRTELKSLDENRTRKDATEKLNSSALPKQEYLSTNSSRSSLEDALEDGREVTLRSNCDHFMDRKPTLHRPGSSDNLSSLAERRSQGSVGEDLPGNRTDFNVPPSPGHIQPLPDKLSQIHHLLQKGEPLPKVLKF